MLLLATVGVIVVLYASLQRFEPGAHVPPPGSDSLIFYTYARAMAEGHPYRFYREDAPTTGSTSHLFPAVLALLYALGAKGASLSTAGFALDGLMYLLLVAAAWHAARRLAPQAAPLAVALTLLSGHVSYNMFYQHDMGLFAPLVMGAFCAGLAGRTAVLGLMLVVATLARPEGALLSGLLVLVSVLPFGPSRRPDWGRMGAGCAGLLAFAGVLALNRYLTGHLRFTSIIGKGLAGSDSAPAVLTRVGEAYSQSLVGLLFGIGEPGERFQQFILLPVLGGVLALWGLASRPWKTGPESRLELWWVLGLLGTSVMVATAGTIGNEFDRYYTWVFPMWYLYAAIGVVEVARRMSQPRVAWIVGGLLVAYQAIGLAFMISVLNISTAELAAKREFVREVNEALPEGSRIGAEGTAWAAYDLTRHKVHNVWGLVSPEFVTTGDSARANIEVLREEPETRFGTWLVNAPNVTGQWYSPFIGEPMDAQLPLFTPRWTLVLHRADWTSLEESGMPRTPGVLEAVRGLELVDKVNVGYEPDERGSGYEIRSRVPAAHLPLMSETLELNGRPVTEAGRVVLGGDSMTVEASAGRDLVMVLRTSMQGGVERSSGVQRFVFETPMSLKITVDGEDAGVFPVLLNGPDEFTEAAYRIPGARVRGDRVRIGVEGDHPAYAYWFYQPAREAAAIGP